MRKLARSVAAAVLALLAMGSADSDWDRYLKRAGTLRKFRDRESLSEKEVLKVLREEGVFAPAETGSGRGHGSFSKGFRPFQVRVYKGLWRWPLRYGIVSSEYGRRWGRAHQGIDIAADPGDEVYAAAPGEVLYASGTLKGYGNVVILRHDNDITSLYAHNTTLLVRKGEKVKLGRAIATVGSTGRSTGPHVHFEIRRKSKPVDPRKLLPKTRF